MIWPILLHFVFMTACVVEGIIHALSVTLDICVQWAVVLADFVGSIFISRHRI